MCQACASDASKRCNLEEQLLSALVQAGAADHVEAILLRATSACSSTFCKVFKSERRTFERRDFSVRVCVCVCVCVCV